MTHAAEQRLMRLTTESFQEYQSRQLVNPSLLQHALKSLKHFRYQQLNPSDDTTDAKRLGTISHGKLLEKDFDAEAIVKESLLEKGKPQLAIYEGRRAGRAWEEFRVQHDDMTIVRRKDYEEAFDQIGTATSIVKAVREHSTCANLLDGCSTEQTVLAYVNDIPCKGRIDAIKPSVIVDLKTTKNAESAAFGKQSASLLNHFRLACYREMARLALGGDFACWIIAAENSPPFDVVPYCVPEELLDQGLRLAKRALASVRWGMENDCWPGLCESEAVLGYPSWAIPDEGVIYE